MWVAAVAQQQGLPAMASVPRCRADSSGVSGSALFAAAERRELCLDSMQICKSSAKGSPTGQVNSWICCMRVMPPSTRRSTQHQKLPPLPAAGGGMPGAGG